MPEKVFPRHFAECVLNGFHRAKRYRRARAMIIKEAVGQYYTTDKGISGDQPIPLIFRAIQNIIPSLVARSGVNEVSTDYVEYEQTAELMSLALDTLQRKNKLPDTLRAGLVSAIFSFAIFKTGLAASGDLYKFDDVDIQAGQIYTSLVDLDDFVFDPLCTERSEAVFKGSRNVVPRQVLLDDDDCDHDLVKALPSIEEPNTADNQNLVSNLTKDRLGQRNMAALRDLVRVVELWVPADNTVVLIPDPAVSINDKFIKIVDYYGPITGPYTEMQLTPPIPGNPFPVAPASLWYDLHRMANSMFKKSVEQAEQQKDIVFYRPAQADEMVDAQDAQTGACIASTDPSAFTQVSFGGQKDSNLAMLSQLQLWFNYMAGNPDQMAGIKSDAATATQAGILQSNAAVTLEDMRERLEVAHSDISEKQAWFLWTDPLIEMPLIKRSTGGQRIQLFLTPEQRRGDFLDYVFKIRKGSTERVDPRVRQKLILDFATNILPAAVNATQMMMALQQPFDLTGYLTLIARELNIWDDVHHLFQDPKFDQKLAMWLQMGPQNSGKAGTSKTGMNKGIIQNGALPTTRVNSTPSQMFNQQSQGGANQEQSMNMMGGGL